MTSQEAGSEISPQELEREALKKNLEKIASWSFDQSSATPRPAEATRVDLNAFLDANDDILANIESVGLDSLFDMLPDKNSFMNDPRYVSQDDDRQITTEGILYLTEQIFTIIEKHGLIEGIDQNHPGFVAAAESFLPADRPRATLDAITALQVASISLVIPRVNELYKPESRSYITSTAIGTNRRMVRSGYSPRKDGITLTDRYASVFGVNRTNTVSIEGKPVTYDQVDATLLGKPLDFYEQFDNINNSLEVTPEIIARLQNYIGLKINTPEFWNIRNDEDKIQLQALLTELSEASDDTVKKQLFSQIISRIFSNVDIAPNIGAMGIDGDMLAAGMPVQARLQEWGRIVFGNESHMADGETPAFSKEASIDMRSAQALFNILIPPERLKDLYTIDHEIATLRKPYDDEIQKVNEATLDEATRKKDLEDIYMRMNRDQQLSEKIVTKTDMRAMYYDAILEAYNVEEPEGFKTADGGDQQLIDQIRARKALLKGKTWGNVNTESETELLKLFSDTDSDENAIRARIKADRKRTRGALLRLEERFGQNFIKNNRAGNDVVIGMGLKGIELLKRRAQSHRMRNTETVEHDLDAIMARTLPTEVTVYGRVEGAPAQQEPAADLVDLLQKLESTAGTAPADEQVEKGAPPPEKEPDQTPSEKPPAKPDPREEASGTNDYARLYEPNYGNLPKSSSPEASSAVEIAIQMMDEGNIDESLEWFRRALNHDYADLQAMFGIAVTTGDVSEQIAMLEHILKKQPNFKAANVLLFNLLSETHGATPPVSVEEPPYPNAPYIEITKLMQDPTPENQRKARELAEALTTKNENDAEAWYLRAILIRGKDKGAIDVKKRHLKRALRADPQHHGAKDELAELTKPTPESAPITRHPLLSRIEEANLNKSAQEALEQVKESTDISDWIDRRINKEMIHRLLASEDPIDEILNELKKAIEEKAKAYALYMQDEFDWPTNKHKENVSIIRDIMLNEIKLRIQQSQQEKGSAPDITQERGNSNTTYIDKLSQALLHSEAHLVITREIGQAFIEGNTQVIEQYLAAGKDILLVDSSTLPDYDSRHFDQVRAEGLKALYLQTLNGAIKDQKDKELLIAQLEKSELPEMLATLLMEDLRMLSPTEVTETDYHKHSARLSGATAKMEAIELLLKLTTPKFARKTGYLLDEGAPLAAAFLYLETVPHSSAPGSHVATLENQYKDYIKTIRNALQIAEKKKPAGTGETPSTMKSETTPASIEDLVRIITEQEMLEEREILHLKEIAHTPEYQSDLNAIVTTMLDILEAKRTYKIIPEDTQFNRESIIMAIERIIITHSVSSAHEQPHDESLPSHHVEKQQLNTDQLVSIIQNNNLLCIDDLFILQTSMHEDAKDPETGTYLGLDFNLEQIARSISKKIHDLVASGTVDPQLVYTQESCINALKMIATTSEIIALRDPTTLDLESTIQILYQLGYDKKIMTGQRGSYLNVPIKMIQQSVNAARHRKEIDENIRLNPATIKLALKEMVRRHNEKESTTTSDEKSLADLETTIKVLREHGHVTDTTLDMLLEQPDDSLIKKDIDYLIKNSVNLVLTKAKRERAVPESFTFNHNSLAEAFFELVKRRRSQVSKK